MSDTPRRPPPKSRAQKQAELGEQPSRPGSVGMRGKQSEDSPSVPQAEARTSRKTPQSQVRYSVRTDEYRVVKFALALMHVGAMLAVTVLLLILVYILSCEILERNNFLALSDYLRLVGLWMFIPVLSAIGLAGFLYLIGGFLCVFIPDQNQARANAIGAVALTILAFVSLFVFAVLMNSREGTEWFGIRGSEKQGSELENWFWLVSGNVIFESLICAAFWFHLAFFRSVAWSEGIHGISKVFRLGKYSLATCFGMLLTVYTYFALGYLNLPENNKSWMLMADRVSNAEFVFLGICGTIQVLTFAGYVIATILLVRRIRRGLKAA